MARGVRALLGADVGVSTTGVAGPTEQDGQPVGTVFVGVAHVGESGEGDVCCHSRAFRFDGDRSDIRQASVQAAWQMCLDVLRPGGHPSGVVSGDS